MRSRAAPDDVAVAEGEVVNDLANVALPTWVERHACLSMSHSLVE
jgi:hypothetical protein